MRHERRDGRCSHLSAELPRDVIEIGPHLFAVRVARLGVTSERPLDHAPQADRKRAIDDAGIGNVAFLNRADRIDIVLLPEKTP